MKKYKINVMKWNLEKYNSNPLSYQKFQILLLMENANTHLVSLFKDYLLFDDTTEFFKEYYKKKEIYERLKTIYDYYESSSYLFPNYTAINEGKYIYRNIIKKQKLIDYLEDLEDKKQEKEEKKAKKNKNLNLYENEQNSSSCFDVFDSKVYNNIIKETGNDSKINELFCVVNNNNEGGDSFASIMKLAEEIKEIKDIKEKENKNKKENKEIKDKTKIKENKDKKENKEIKENKEGKEGKENKDIYVYSKKDSNINLNNINNKIKNRIESKIYVSRRVGINQTQNPNNQNSNQNNINSKKIFKKAKVNININNILNNNFSNLNSKNITHNNSNRNHVISNDTGRNNEYLKSNLSNASYSNNKNNYKKNNIIINIINNNKTNNYQSNINYFSNYTSNNNNQNENINSDSNRNNNLITTDSSKYNSINCKKYTSKNNNKSKNNTTIKDQSQNELKSVIIKYSKNHSKKLPKKIKTDTKSKLLSFRLTTDVNLTDRIKNGVSQSKLNKSGKDQSKTKSLISPRNNMKKRTKTEILGTQSDIFLFGQQNEINPYSYNKSINRQILKNINLTNTHKPHKDISLINKKIINYHFGINSNKIDKKCIKHISTNSQNLTGVNIINKVSPLPLKDIVKKKIGVFSFNNTERTSRNHSKEQINKQYTVIKRNHLDSFSPKKTQELIYKKMKKIYNKKSAIICSFFKSVGSNKKIKDLKNKKKNINNNSNINCNNYKGINSAINSKEIFNNTVKDKKF